ncbi:MAG: M23 family metallopeptidase [Halofilum sp. (in: g-proteobacteria)]|nr:M23 family metallopeptidase [Halofilum sp. (in: g-proteobacteria)]
MFNLIFIRHDAHGRSVRRSLHARWHFVALGTLAAVTLGGAGAIGYLTGRTAVGGGTDVTAAALQTRLAAQQEELEAVRQQASSEVKAMTRRLARLKSHVTRLDALGRKLIDVSNIDADEFDFGSEPGIGGPETSAGRRLESGELGDEVASLARVLEDRERQLSVLDDVLAERRLDAASTPAGEPIVKGWMSSSYGYREDPFTGERAWHGGVDFAGREGSPVNAVGAGVVTYAGERWGYGNLVEVTHGDGYVTRYGHNANILVKEGEVVRRGDQLAEMGSTGRSTGPHVHLEVLKDGESVNPWKYVKAER